MTTPRPLASLASLDLETTGTAPLTDRILEIGIVREEPDGTRTTRRWLVNPGMPIPATASAVHGITDADVADAATFAQAALGVAEFLDGCDLVVFNGRAFDLPLLRAECDRAGLPWPCEGAHIIDVFVIYRERERHTLANATRLYCGRELVGAHGAVADAAATLDVLQGMRLRYDDLPRDAEGLDAESNPRKPDWASACGRIRWDVEGHLVFAFGRDAGKRVTNARSYASWLLGQTWAPDDVKALLRRVLRNESVRREAEAA